MSQTEGEESRKCILAVDDNAIILSRIETTLSNEYDVVTVNSGMRALRFLRQKRPDLILMDIQMTPKDGIETLRDIRNMDGRKDVPVIMLTGVEDKGTVLRSARLGIRDYLLKPFYSDELLKRIRRVFEKEEQERAEQEEQAEQQEEQKQEEL